MALRVAIVGPGRVGTALGSRLAEAGANLLGFVGRTPATAALAVAFCGHGRVLQLRDLATAHVVLIAVGDEALPGVVQTIAMGASLRPCSLCLHTSGRFGVEVLAPLAAAGVRFGALHPVVPFPDVETGLRALPGAPAVLAGPASSMRLLLRLASLLGMRPIESMPGDRTLYHAGCALAANGLTALAAAVELVLTRSGMLAPADAGAIGRELMQKALQLCVEQGPAAALSGPVVRGDDGTILRHRASLAAVAPGLDQLYRALMRQALQLAVDRGLEPAAAAAVASALERGAGR